MRTYTRNIAGANIRQQLSDDDAKRLGLDSPDPDPAPGADEPPPAETPRKRGRPSNKSRATDTNSKD